ncbi:MAG: hypothetical protein K0B16_01135 [Burkholderiaceae bacterium]|nr:hypothetical protein [Burkholderiaceae bacterium]
MKTHRALSLPVVLIGSALAAWVIAFLVTERSRVRQEGRKTEALNEWENEGGRVAAPAPPRPDLTRRP